MITLGVPNEENPTFTLGGPGTCKVNYPQAVAVVNDTVYMGESSGFGSDNVPKKGHILKLAYCKCKEIHINQSCFV